MDVNLIVFLIILLLVIGGFISSEAVLISVWRSEDKKGKSKSKRRFRNSGSPENCYDDCMTESHWDAGHISSCFAACKA
ncbi:MAG: hypothetical protein ACLQPD_16645 [Desulfomonilaceae bacterium]